MDQHPSDSNLNVLARLIGWEEEGGGKIEILVDVGPLRVGERYQAKVRTVSIGRQPPNFDHLRKIGLRTGGLVVLRKVADEGNGVLSARSVETVINRETDGLPYLIHGAAVCILAPPPGTAMVAECLVTMAAEAAMVRKIEDAMAAIKSSLEQACQFGKAGIILTGEDRNGDVREVMVGGCQRKSADDLAAEFMEKCTEDVIQLVKRSKKPWRLAAFFRGEVDLERSSKLSAMRANHAEYGEADEPAWTRANVVMRAFSDSWLVCDATPSRDVPGEAPELLFDLLQTS